MRYRRINGRPLSPLERLDRIEKRVDALERDPSKRSERQAWAAMWRDVIGTLLKRLPIEHIGYGVLVLLLLAAHKSPEFRDLLLTVLGLKK